MDKPRILLVDDEVSIQCVLQDFLKRKDCEVTTAGSAEEALSLLKEQPPAVALLDIVLPGKNGIELLADIRQWCRDCQVIVITGHGSVDSAVEAIRLGAYDYLQKPFRNLEEVWISVSRALEKRALLAEREHQTHEISGAIARLSSLLDRGPATADPALVPGFLPGQVRETDADHGVADTDTEPEPCLEGDRES